jgi:hypothetical protein
MRKQVNSVSCRLNRGKPGGVNQPYHVQLFLSPRFNEVVCVGPKLFQPYYNAPHLFDFNKKNWPTTKWMTGTSEGSITSNQEPDVRQAIQKRRRKS